MRGQGRSRKAPRKKGNCQNPRCKKGDDGGRKALTGKQQKFCSDACKQAVQDMKSKERKKQDV